MATLVALREEHLPLPGSNETRAIVIVTMKKYDVPVKCTPGFIFLLFQGLYPDGTVLETAEKRMFRRIPLGYIPCIHFILNFLKVASTGDTGDAI